MNAQNDQEGRQRSATDDSGQDGKANSPEFSSKIKLRHVALFLAFGALLLPPLHNLLTGSPSQLYLKLLLLYGKLYETVPISLDFLGEREYLRTVIGLLLLLFSWFAFFYLILAGWRKASNHMRISLCCCAVLAWLTWWNFQNYSNRVDWTSRGLNPDRPGFQPEVVLLAGTFTYRELSISGLWHSGEAMFEVRMNGSDHQYSKRWRQDEWEPGAWVYLELNLPGFSAHKTLAKFSYSTKGGGSTDRESDDTKATWASRLWNEDTFVGVNPNNLINKQGERTEEFADLKKVGPWLIPQTIHLTEGNGRFETYTIRKVEFLPGPPEEWFWKIKRKYFDRDPSLVDLDLDEPGLSSEWKYYP